MEWALVPARPPVGGILPPRRCRRPRQVTTMIAGWVQVHGFRFRFMGMFHMAFAAKYSHWMWH
jgi:hypothetical protein